MGELSEDWRLTHKRHELIEEEILQLTKDILEATRARLKAAGIASEPVELEITGTDSGTRTSEVRVYFRREADVVDVLEFHVFERGKQVVTAAKIKEWLPAQIDSVIQLANRSPQ
jgi:hypothetical protein